MLTVRRTSVDRIPAGVEMVIYLLPVWLIVNLAGAQGPVDVEEVQQGHGHGEHAEEDV